jgi:co-chaperonin GroES (HSP10)
MTEQVEEVIENQEDKATQLPEPKGYKILCALPEVEDKFSNGILKADTTLKTEEHSSVILFVLKMGADCYKDASRFPNGPYCNEGDFVLTRAYSGTRFKIHGREFRLINDDSIEAVVQDPRGYTRA